MSSLGSKSGPVNRPALLSITSTAPGGRASTSRRDIAPAIGSGGSASRGMFNTEGTTRATVRRRATSTRTSSSYAPTQPLQRTGVHGYASLDLQRIIYSRDSTVMISFMDSGSARRPRRRRARARLERRRRSGRNRRSPRANAGRTPRVGAFERPRTPRRHRVRARRVW